MRGTGSPRRAKELKLGLGPAVISLWKRIDRTAEALVSHRHDAALSRSTARRATDARVRGSPSATS